MDALPRLFVGLDDRETIGHAVFTYSVLSRASCPVSITAIGESVAHSDGSTAFALSRFHVPRLCQYQGWALWLDGADMLCMTDIADLWALRDEHYAVQVVQHSYKTRHARKHIATSLESLNEDYDRKNWSSVILWNCAHPANAVLTDHMLADREGRFLHRFAWLADEQIGAIAPQWNYLCDEPNQCAPATAKIAHATLGGWWFPYYQNSQFATMWREELRRMLRSA